MKMETPELNVVHFHAEDVIATSAVPALYHAEHGDNAHACDNERLHAVYTPNGSSYAGLQATDGKWYYPQLVATYNDKGDFVSEGKRVYVPGGTSLNAGDWLVFGGNFQYYNTQFEMNLGMQYYILCPGKTN